MTNAEKVVNEFKKMSGKTFEECVGAMTLINSMIGLPVYDQNKELFDSVYSWLRDETERSIRNGK